LNHRASPCESKRTVPSGAVCKICHDSLLLVLVVVLVLEIPEKSEDEDEDDDEEDGQNFIFKQARQA
jgi:hypothetical protein